MCPDAFLIIVRMEAHYFISFSSQKVIINFSALDFCTVMITVQKSSAETIEKNAAVSLRPVYPRKWTYDKFINQ